MAKLEFDLKFDILKNDLTERFIKELQYKDLELAVMEQIVE